MVYMIIVGGDCIKKHISIVLTLLIILSTLSGISVGAETEDTNDSDTLIVTANGMNPTQVKVGNEFIYYVVLFAGDKKIVNGQVEMTFDSDYVSVVPYSVTNGEDEDMALYSFPASLNNAGLVYYTGNKNLINYNFSRINGVGVFNQQGKLFTRFRFKATAAGTTDITHSIQYMMNADEVSVYYDSVPNDEIKPYTDITIEPSVGCVGDADGDFDVTIMDASELQRLAAGANLAYDMKTADVSGDKFISLRDAMILRKYLAGKDNYDTIGTWLFASEMN